MYDLLITCPEDLMKILLDTSIASFEVAVTLHKLQH